MKKKQPLEKWIQIYTAYVNTGEKPACPFCQHDSIVIEQVLPKQQSIVFRCENCGKWVHID